MKNTSRPSVFLVFVIIFLITESSFSQSPQLRFQHLSVENGLSNNRLYEIIQDKPGLIWISTDDGLNRYDGYKVEVFRHERGNKNSLPNNVVRCLFIDSKGTVWIGTEDGLAYYDENSNSFRSFYSNSKDENSLTSGWISVIREDANGIIWIGTNSGLCSFNKKDKRFQRYIHNDHSNSISGNYVNDIEFTQDGTMWIATTNGLNRLDLTTMRFTSFFHDPKNNATISGNNLSKISIDKSGNAWIAVHGGLILEKFDTKTNECKHFTSIQEKQGHVPSNFLRDIFIDRSGRIWLATNASGLKLFLPDLNTFHEYQADFLNSNKLQSNKIGSVFQDNSGMIWLATFGGAERFNPDESKFLLYTIPSSANSVEYKSVRAIAEDSSYRLWIGTSNGVYVLDRNTGSFISYQWKPNDRYSLNDNDVYSVCCDKSGNMWVGTNSGLNFFDPVRKNFHVLYAQQDTFKRSTCINRIVSGKNGDLFVGSSSGLSVYNFKDEAMHGLLNNATRTIYEDNNGILWIGTRTNGLIRYNQQTGKVERFTNNKDDSSSIAANWVQSIIRDHNGKMWIGTISGLCSFNEITGTFTSFSEKNGLPNINVSQLQVDERNRIWMATNRGISMLNETRTSFTNYDPNDGLQGWEFGNGTSYKTHDGYFCYSGKNGFNIFHPDSIRLNNFIPPLILKRIMIFDRPLNIDSSYSKLSSLELSYKQNFFSFEFAALNYDHPEKNQYACQLLGFDKKIVQLGKNPVINYTNVPPGNYTLKVQASNNDGVWNEQGYELELIIIPPFWATWWFKTIVVVAICGGVLLYFKLRENRIKQEQQRQTDINKQIAEIKMVALRAQMNPHFIFNSLNSIQHFIAIREKKEALNYLSKFSKLIRKILENSRENTVSISNELQLLELYIQLEQLRFNNKFDYYIKIDGEIDTENTEIPPLLIQPYIENAILHGLISKESNGILRITIEKNKGLLVFKIEDNGIGRAKAQEIERKKVSNHKSLGIKVTNERISGLFELLDYKMDVVIEDLFDFEKVSGKMPAPAGTKVIISIPVKEEE